jgi:phospholipid/cholesterol/gamma-HCH transport system substrate-binding protein
MAEYFRKETKAGALILVALVVLGVLIFIVGDFQNLFGKKQTLKVLFASAQGIEINAPVAYAGVTVGRVAEIRILAGKELEKVEKKQVELLLEIGGQVDLSTIKEITIRPKGFLGDMYVDITPSPGGAKSLPEKTVYLGKEAKTMEEVMQTVDDIGKEFRLTLTSINSVVASKEFKASLKRMIVRAEQAMDGAASIFADNREDIQATIESLKVASADLKVLLAKSRDPAVETVANFQELSGQMRTKLDTLADGLNRLASKAEYVVDDNSGNLYAVILNLRSISENFKELSADLKERPWRLVNLFGNAEQESTSSSSEKPVRPAELELRRDGGLGKPASR